MNTHVLTFLTACLLFPFGLSAQWWTAMGDTVLNSLETRALDANYDVDAALRRVAVANQQLVTARSAYFPSVGVSAGWEKERHVPSAWSLGANASWEIDLFGKVRASARRGKAQVRVSRAELEGSRLSVAAAVATAYVELRMYQANLDFARRQAEDQKKVADMVQARYDAGLSNRMEVAQSLTTYYSTSAAIPPLETSVASSLSALSVLLAVPSSELSSELLAPAPIPADGFVLLPAEVEADAVRNRPDVMAAEAQIDAAAAALGIAKKEYLPSLSLTGSITTAHHTFNKLFTDSSLGYSIAPTLSWTVFDGLARRAGVREAREQLQIAVDSYNGTLLNGYEEIQNSITDYHNTLRAVDMLGKTVEQCETALEKSIDLYKLDLTDFTSVMQAQASLLNYKTRLIETRAQVLTSFINFHKSVGL